MIKSELIAMIREKAQEGKTAYAIGVEFTKRCDLFSLEHCILNAFEYFGSVSQTVLADNMKTVIIGRESGKPVWNAGFLDFSNDLGFAPKVCQVRRPKIKRI